VMTKTTLNALIEVVTGSIKQDSVDRQLDTESHQCFGATMLASGLH
jgi:hypothetical protein